MDEGRDALPAGMGYGHAITVCWAEGDVVHSLPVTGALPASVGEALELLAPALPTAVRAALTAGALQVALHGRVCAPGAVVHPGDRIELLAGLQVDPKVARQRRVQARRRAEGRSRWLPDRGEGEGCG